jgi:hypothetical protein
MLSLRELQLRFAAALAPGGAEPAAIDPALLALISGRGALDPAQRLEIYAGMYRARLVDVLREDFPRVLAILGDEEFGALAERYLARHPSTHPSVRHVGRRFADFVAGEAAAPFLGDLARLEWARGEVFDAADAEPLSLSDLSSVAPEDWPALRFQPIPACLVIECAWPVHEIWAEADTPDAGAPVHVRPATCTLRVWREGGSVSHAAMGDLERRAFPALQRGEPFGVLCAELDGAPELENGPAEIGALLVRWLEDGLLTRVAGGEEP